MEGFRVGVTIGKSLVAKPTSSARVLSSLLCRERAAEAEVLPAEVLPAAPRLA